MLARHTVMATLVAATFVLVSQSVFAADSKADAEKHFKVGVALLEAEDWPAAAAEFERSVQLFPTKMGLFNLANAYRAMHRYQEALDTADRVEREFAQKLDPEFKEAMAELRREIRGMVGHLRVRVEEDGAEITVDGRVVGKSPLEPFVLAPGEHEVKVSLGGYATQQHSVQINVGETTREKFDLEREKTAAAVVPVPPVPAPTPKPAQPVVPESEAAKPAQPVDSEPPARPAQPVAGGPVAKPEHPHPLADAPKPTPPVAEALPTKPPSPVVLKTAVPPPIGEEDTTAVEAESDHKHPYAFFWVAFAGTLISGAFTIGFGAAGSARNEDFNKLVGEYQNHVTNWDSDDFYNRMKDAKQDADTYKNATIGFGVSTGVFGTLALIGLITGASRSIDESEPEPESDVEVDVAPEVSAVPGGLAVSF